jgi:hypothetical protein
MRGREVTLLTHVDFKASVYQAVIFTPDEEFSTAKVMKDFYPIVGDQFDAEPVVTPPLAGFPAQVPRITLNNKENSYRLEIAAARANFYWREAKEGQPFLEQDEFYKEATRLLCGYQEIVGCRIGRLAALLTRYAQHETPGLFLAQHCCKEDWGRAPLDRPESFELHARKTYTVDGVFRVNSWVRNKTGRLTREETVTPIVLVEQDINTLAEEAEDRSFTPQEIERFFGAVVGEFESILRLYYPE